MRNLSRSMIPVLFLLAGCGDDPDDMAKKSEPAPEPTIFKVQTDDAKVNSLLPAIRNSLPGLDKYADQFQKIHVEQNQWLTVMFNIPENAKIPNEYASQGHNCFIEINKEGTAIKVPKRACKSMALNRDVGDLESDYWFYLGADDLTYQPHDFSKLSAEQRINLAKDYLQHLDAAVKTVQQKEDWKSYDFPNYSRWFKQLEREGERFAPQSTNIFNPYQSCRLAGTFADTWWHTQLHSLDDLTSNEAKRIQTAVKHIEGNYADYSNAVKGCQKEVKEAPPKPKKTEILPPTPDNKPPRAGCLMIFKADNTTEWGCPIVGD